MTENLKEFIKKYHLRIAKEDEDCCMNCEYGIGLLGGGPAQCNNKKVPFINGNGLNELARCDLWEQRR